jgi:hypothetical protein
MCHETETHTGKKKGATHGNARHCQKLLRPGHSMGLGSKSMKPITAKTPIPRWERNDKKAFEAEEHAANAQPSLDWKTYHENSEKLSLGWGKKS